MSLPHRGIPYSRAPGITFAGLVSTDIVFKADPVGDSATTALQIPTPYSKCRLVRAAIVAGTIGADSDGTILAHLVKREASGDTDVSVSATVSLESDGITAKEYAAFTLVATKSKLVFENADRLEVDFVSNSGMNTAPDDIAIVCEWMIVE